MVVDLQRVEEADDYKHHVVERIELETSVVRDYTSIRQNNQQVLMPHKGARHVSISKLSN